MSEKKPSRIELMLDLLVEEIRERIETSRASAALGEAGVTTGETQSAEAEPAEVAEPARPLPGRESEEEAPPPPSPSGEPEFAVAAPLAAGSQAAGGQLLPPHVGPAHAARLMGRLALGLLILVVVINIPFNRHGTRLATAMPDAASFVIRDGFVAKEEDDAEIYVYQDAKFRWISSLDAFEHYGYTWGDVHIVPDGYLRRYELGAPIHVLLKCAESPHIYRLEEGRKRWIRDIDTFGSEGHVWEDVRFVSCEHLRELEDGETIPPGSGPPPQP